MFTSKAQGISEKQLLKLLEEAKNAELCRDIESSRRVFAPFWSDIELNPDVSDFEPIIQAELLRLCGFFLSWYGRSHCKLNYQLRGKDLLTNAVELFERLGFDDKMSEARVMLALCYWYEGEIDECEAILQFTEDQFRSNQLHPVYLQIRVNRLMTMHWKKDCQRAVKLIDELKIPMEFCQDMRLKTMYHNQAGIFYVLLKKYDQAVFNHNEAIRFARRIKSSRFIATNLNNLAFLYMETGDFAAAHRHLEEALKIFERLDDTGWIPHVLDTKSLTLKKEGKYRDALQTIEKAISYFERGEDYSGLVDALWTKTEILLLLERKTDALNFFNKLSNLAAARIGESAAEKYARKFADLIYVSKTLSLTEAVKSYKRDVIRKSLAACGASVSDSASELGISHQSLSGILHSQFPELRREFKLDERAPRGLKTISKKSRSKVQKTSGCERVRKIAPFDLSNCEIAFRNFQVSDDDEIFAFVVPSDKLAQFNIEDDAVILVTRDDFRSGEPFLIFERENGEYDVGIAILDEILDFYFLINQARDPEPFTPEKILAVGRIVGFCLLENFSGDEIEFRSLLG